MFVEEKKSGETQVEQPSLAGFIAWLEKQSGSYNWIDARTCACAQYAGAIRQQDSWERFQNIIPRSVSPHALTWKILNSIAHPNGSSLMHNCTFSGALKRARAIQKCQ